MEDLLVHRLSTDLYLTAEVYFSFIVSNQLTMPFVQLQFRRGLSTEWTSNNPTLASGEMGIETNTNQFKIGDGTTAWNSLAYGGIMGPTGNTGAASTVTGPSGSIGIDGFSGGLTLQLDYTTQAIATAATVTTFAGSSQGSANGTGTNAQFSSPVGVALDSDRNLYVADRGNHRIRKITPAGVVTTFAGSSAGSADGTGTNATFNEPYFVALDSSGNLYVADVSNHRIRKITPAGVVTTLAGSSQGNADGTATNAQFSRPYGLAVDSTGNVYVADSYGFRFRKITPAGVVTTFAGNTSQGNSNGTGTNASFQHPTAVVIDSSGNLFVVDNNQFIRKITPAAVVTTFAGSFTGGSADGTGTNATFNGPYGLAIDSSDNIYVAEIGGNKIRKVTPEAVVTTLAGTSTAGSADGVGTNAGFNFPWGVAIDLLGNLFVGDYSNHRIRKVVVPTGLDPNIYAGVPFTGTPAYNLQ